MSPVRILAVLVVPVMLLVTGFGLGNVLAGVGDYPAPDGREAFRAAPRELLKETRPNREGPSRSEKRKAERRSKECRRLKKSAKRRCRKGVRELLEPTVAKDMTESKARKEAEKNAERVYDNDFGAEAEGIDIWTEFGLATSKCKVLQSNSRVCAVFVAFVDDDPESSDYQSSYECQWVVKSTNLLNGKLEVKDSFRRDRACYWNDGY